MPVLYLTEDDVRQVLTMDLAIEAVEAGLRKMALEEAFTIPRSRCQTDQTVLHVLPAAAKTLGFLGLKVYTTNRRGNRFHVTIYDGKTGEMVALLQADFLGQMRTGAASAVATRCLARADAASLGVFGSGKQARTQVLGIAEVRKLARVNVYSPNEERRKQFAGEMSAAIGVEVVPVSTPEEAARNLDIIATATNSREPVLFGEWLSPGMHLNIVGSNFLAKSEIDVEVIRRASFVAIDNKEQGQLEAGDFSAAIESGLLSWSDVNEIGRVVANRLPGRQSPQDVTLFKSLGIGLEDVAVAGRVFTLAKERVIGKWLDI